MLCESYDTKISCLLVWSPESGLGCWVEFLHGPKEQDTIPDQIKRTKGQLTRTKADLSPQVIVVGFAEAPLDGQPLAGGDDVFVSKLASKNVKTMGRLHKSLV